MVWQGTLALQGCPAFGARAQAAGRSSADADSGGNWSVLPSTIESTGKVEAAALKNHLETLCSKRAKWAVQLACFRGDDDAAKGAQPAFSPRLGLGCTAKLSVPCPCSGMQRVVPR